jgi:hypothetical protein
MLPHAVGFSKESPGRRRHMCCRTIRINVFELTDITVHPGEKMPGSISARRELVSKVGDEL